MELRATTAIIYSNGSRKEYVRQAQNSGETYHFPSAFGYAREWLKGEYAYLAVNAVPTVLHRFAIKHDVVSESEFIEHRDSYSELFIPNAVSLGREMIDAVGEWIERPGAFLFVSGRTNLPPELLGLSEYQERRPDGYTGWRWTPDSPFSDHELWGEYHISSYRGYTYNAARASESANVLADLFEFTGDLTSPCTSNKRRLGDGIVATDRTIYIANQLFEFLGAVIQAHVNVEDIRLWNNPTHWGDTLAYFVHEILRTRAPHRLWQTRLQPFGTYDGALQLRHDTDHEASDSIDLSMLEYQVQNAVPASYYVMDPKYCTTRCTDLGTRIWLNELARYNFIEVAQHNDSVDGDPPRWIVGTGLYQHISESDRNLGIRSRTAGRHMGFLVYPETIDAMDYLYENDPEMLGLCTFSLYDMLAYGERNPEVVVLGKQLTYVTYDHERPSIPAAIPGYWFPYNVVVSTVDEHKQLRGWDVTHDTDCDFDRIEELFDGRNAHDPKVQSKLNNGVFTIQYETQLARDPHTNDGYGHLPWMRYAIAYAERNNYWLMTKEELYERMNDYRDVVFRPDADGCFVHNPTRRPISGLAVEVTNPSGFLVDGKEILIHVVGQRRSTLPMLQAGEQRNFRYRQFNGIPIITQPNSRFLELSDARYYGSDRTVSVSGRAIRQSHLVINNLKPDRTFVATVSDNRGEVKVGLTSNSAGSLAVPIHASYESRSSFNVSFSVD
jgi:hypothetical protein